MSFLELARKRYSVRKFSGRAVEEEKAEQILEAGRAAPTACNLQPQRILVLRGGEALDKLKGCTDCHFDAPLAFIVCYDKNSAWVRSFDGAGSGEIDASIVATHMMMAAADAGLGSTWVMYFDPGAVRRVYNLPEDFVPVAILPVGYPAEDAEPSEKHFARLPLGETTRYDSF